MALNVKIFLIYWSLLWKYLWSRKKRRRVQEKAQRILKLIKRAGVSLTYGPILFLKGKQVIAVCNFEEKNIAGVVSQVLILGSIDKEGRVTLVHPSQKAENGLPIA